MLVAAAFEDTIRCLGEAKAAVTGRPKFEDVIGRLKTACVIVGPSLSIAQSYLRFRMIRYTPTG